LKKKILLNDNSGSSDPALVFIICVGMVSLLVLFFGEVLTPFFSIMKAGIVRDFLLAFWPNGLLISMMVILIFTMLMAYQKKYYHEGG
jgi:hypothetical protein